MSMTSALAFGLNEDYCSSKCGRTKASTYFNSLSLSPYSDHKMRPAMMLAGAHFELVKALIDRGIAADRQFPEGRAYLLSTPDKARSVRATYSAVGPFALLSAGPEQKTVHRGRNLLRFSPPGKCLRILPGTNFRPESRGTALTLKNYPR